MVINDICASMFLIERKAKLNFAISKKYEGIKLRFLVLKYAVKLSQVYNRLYKYYSQRDLPTSLKVMEHESRKSKEIFVLISTLRYFPYNLQ